MPGLVKIDTVGQVGADQLLTAFGECDEEVRLGGAAVVYDDIQPVSMCRLRGAPGKGPLGAKTSRITSWHRRSASKTRTAAPTMTP